MNGTLLLISLNATEDQGLRRALMARGFTLVDGNTPVTVSGASFDEHERRHAVALATRFAEKAGPILAALRRTTLEVVAAQRYAQEIPDLRGIVLSVDTFAGLRYLAQASVPTFLVPHAVLPWPRHERRWDGSHVFAQHVCSPGPFSTTRYSRQAGLQVHETGRPRWDSYATLDRGAVTVEALAALNLDPTRPLVVYGSTWIERSTAHATRHLPAMVQVFQDVCRTVAAEGAQLVVKLHPGEVQRCRNNVAGLAAGYTAVARAAGLARCLVTAGYREGLLCAADVVVAMNSNLGLEALLCGTPVLNVPLVPEDAACLFDPRDEGSAVFAVHAPTDVSDALSAMLTLRLHEKMARHAETTVRRYVHQPDGQAGERVADVISNLLH